ncbi:MAG: glycerophosphodiester phosphodiesterase [Kangiellaceae bacterium]|nr:glycerophosphodiester phosphodiesterase [Kangiellaceae bacterium]
MDIFAHRGASGLYPENTLLAFAKALEIGCEGLEFDVRLCGKDDHKQLVVFHDKKLDRCTDGKGKLKDCSFDYVRSLDAGEGQIIPTLDEVCKLVSTKALINIELKGKNTAEPVMDYLLSQQNIIPLQQFIISSFRYKELKKIRKISSQIKIGVLVKKNYKKGFKQAKKLSAYSIHPYLKTVKQKHIIKAHKKGLKALVYTVNTMDDLNRLEEWKVDGVFSDFPNIICHSHESENLI